MSAIPRIAAAAGLAALALAVGRPTADAQPPGSQGGSCFYLSQLDQLRADGPRTLYVRVSGRRVYRIDLQTDCPGLEGGSHPPVMSAKPTDEVCGPMNLDIHVMGAMCTPRAIVRLTDAEVAALPKSAKP